MNYKHLSGQTSGFTLTELLTVVVIVGLLTALATGYYKKSVEQSRFAEGLTAASAIVEGLNQAYLEDITQGVTPADAAKARKIGLLPSLVTGTGSCASTSPADYCVATKHFQIEVDSTSGNVVYAYRGSTEKYRYYLQLHTNYDSSFKDRIACVGSTELGKNNDAKAFCESMGYTNCSSTTNVCTKP